MYMRGLPGQLELAVIIPSTGRAEQCAHLVERIHETTERPVKVVISIEPGDISAYHRALAAFASQRRKRVQATGWSDSLTWMDGSYDPFPGVGHVAAINRGAHSVLPAEEPTMDGPWSAPKIIVKMDDDHWPVTQGWDVQYLAALQELGGTGVVYGNDLFQGERLPTVPGIATNIIRELGWYAPPQLGHLYCDNFWLELGRRSGRLTYLPETIIEHRHPQAGKGERDAVYAAGGESPERWSQDSAEWENIITPGLELPSGYRSQMDEWAGQVRRLAEPESISLETHESHWYALTSAGLAGTLVVYRCALKWSDGTLCDYAWSGPGAPMDAIHRRAVTR
jgi:hypothetical protein